MTLWAKAKKPKTLEPRVPFNAKNPEHLLAYAYYCKYNKWGNDGCRFELEPEWNDIPSMCASKSLEHYLNQVSRKL